jgi:hypothetical protein
VSFEVKKPGHLWADYQIGDRSVIFSVKLY